jgi:hypothetical protein
MRRAFAISLAFLVVMFAARGVMAQDVQQDGNDLLLKILKDRNILSEDEYQEIKGQLATEKNTVDQKLTAIDRSLADYLAKAGDTTGGNTVYVQNQGVTFNSGDGMWSVFFGGLFQFGYVFRSEEFDSDFSQSDDEACEGGFWLKENRFDFGGTIFDKNLWFYTQIQTTWYDFDDEYSGFIGTGHALTLLDAYVNYMFAPGVAVRAGLFKIPNGRQALTDQSDRAFGRLTPVASYFSGSRDFGLMLHGMYDVDEAPDGFVFEWAAGLWNGEGDNLSRTDGFDDDEVRLAYGARAAVYPFGYVPYVEGDWTGAADPRLGIGGSIFWDEWETTGSGDNPTWMAYEFDLVGTWSGLFFLAEYFGTEYDPGSGSDFIECGWYVQAGFMVMPAEFEVFGRYGQIDKEGGVDYTDWALGGAWYFNGHELKLIAEIGQQTSEQDLFNSDTEEWYIALILQADW